MFAVCAITWSRLLDDSGSSSPNFDSIFDLGEVQDCLLKASSVSSDVGNRKIPIGPYGLGALVYSQGSLYMLRFLHFKS